MAWSPLKSKKEISEGTNVILEEGHATGDDHIGIKVRLSPGKESVGEELIEQKRNYWREFFTEQRSKVRHILATVDKRVWQILDTELKVNLHDPDVRGEQVMIRLDEEEATIKRYLDA
jgi:hypothetical protein